MWGNFGGEVRMLREVRWLGNVLFFFIWFWILEWKIWNLLGKSDYVVNGRFLEIFDLESDMIKVLFYERSSVLWKLVCCFYSGYCGVE